MGLPTSALGRRDRREGRRLPTIFCRSGQVTGTTAIAKNGQSSVLDRGAASPDQKSFVARSPAVTLAAAAHRLAVPFFSLSGTFSGKSKWEQISGKLPPIGIGKAAPLVLSRSTFVFGKDPIVSTAVRGAGRRIGRTLSRSSQDGCCSPHHGCFRLALICGW